MRKKAISIEDLFNENYHLLDSDTVMQMNSHYGTGELNNVIVGLDRHCYGLLLVDDKPKIVYQIFYVNGYNKLEGHILQLMIEDPERDNLVFCFSNYLSDNFKELDTIETFNTFQKHTRTMLEKLEYLTINPTNFKKYGDPKPTFIAKDVKGIVPVLMIDKNDFYKDFFGNLNMNDYSSGEEFIYLMLNSRSGLVKIGNSRNPNFREKTLQSQEPEVILIALWEAPRTIEKDLHRQFSSRRQRGEWFDLTFRELKLIKEQMEKYVRRTST